MASGLFLLAIIPILAMTFRYHAPPPLSTTWDECASAPKIIGDLERPSTIEQAKGKTARQFLRFPHTMCLGPRAGYLRTTFIVRRWRQLCLILFICGKRSFRDGMLSKTGAKIWYLAPFLFILG
jgi:hypothetical protein